MHDAIIIGDGPGGLSAALFLAKKKKDVVVFGTDQTPMHKAMLYNYLGIPSMSGSDFQEVARKQVLDMGAKLHNSQALEASREPGKVTVVNNEGQKFEAKYCILATGAKADIAEQLDLNLNDRKLVDADRNGRTAVDNVYAVGWATRPDKIQAVISAGDGAAAALDILSREAGKEIHDFDVVQ